MEYRRYLLEYGMGADIHGGDITKAAERAARDARSRCSLAGLFEIFNVGSVKNTIKLKVKICCPDPDALNCQRILDVFDYCEVTLEVEKGGGFEEGVTLPVDGSKDYMVVAVAIITVYVSEQAIQAIK